MEKPITLPELERAINYWRKRVPASGEESRLCKEAAYLAAPYALMIISHRREIARDDLGPNARSAFDLAEQDSVNSPGLAAT